MVPEMENGSKYHVKDGCRTVSYKWMGLDGIRIG